MKAGEAVLDRYTEKYAALEIRGNPATNERFINLRVPVLCPQGEDVMKLKMVACLMVVLAVGSPIAFGATIDYENGSRYEGEVDDDGRPNGYGKKYRSSGIIDYEGQWIRGEQHGLGREYFGDGNVHYEGEFRNGKREGLGRRYHRNGNKRYEGQRFKDRRHGWGTLYYRDGRIRYEGQWRNHHRNGWGIEYNKDGDIKHKGEWENNERVN